jgi:hypothetical protein
MKIIGVSGRKRSGKNTTYLFGKLLLDEDETGKVVKVAFADALKRMARDEYGWSGLKDTAGRKLLQDLGVGKRESEGENFWVTKWKDEVLRLEHSANPPQVVFATDVRFPNEANAIKDMGGEVWRVERPDIKATDFHVSETALDNYGRFDLVIKHRTLDQLFYPIQARLIRLGLLEP